MFLLSEEEQSHLKYLSEKLTSRQKIIFKAKVLGLKQKEIAFLLSISEPAVSKQLKKVKQVVKKRGQTSITTIGVKA